MPARVPVKDLARAMSVWPIIGLILAVALSGTLLIWRAAWWADDLEARRTRAHVGPVFEHINKQLGVSVADYAWWDDAYEQLQLMHSGEWARDNLSEGSVIGRDRAVDGVIVLDGEDKLLHGLWQGDVLEQKALAGLSGGLAELAAQARASAMSVPVPVTAALAKDGTIALAAAAAVVPINPELRTGTKEQSTVIVFLRTLSPDYIQSIGSLYLLPQARMVKSPGDDNYLALNGIDGATLGYLVWHPAKPGTDLLRSIRVETAIMMLALGAIAGLVLCQLVVQRRTLQLQVRMIDEGAERLTGSLALLTSALQAVDYGIAMYDRDAHLQHWNDAYVKLWALPAGLLQRGIHASRVLDHSFNVAGFQMQGDDEIGGTASDPYRLERTGRWIYRRGDSKVIAARRLPLPDGGFLSVSSDMTQQVSHERELVGAREQAVLANRSKSEFLANVSHELRTPLNAIIGFSEILSRELFGPLGSERYRNYVGDIHSSGEHLLSLINDILDLSKIESGRFKLRLEVFDCVELATSVARLIRPRSQEHMQELVLDLPPAPIGLNADKRALKQVLINLLSNAVKFTPEGGRVALGASAVKGGVEFSVSDTGIGIDEKDIEVALAPFGQIDSNYSRRHEGTGLGLPIVNGIVALHNGTLKVASRVGAGTTVTIFVPDQGIVGGAIDTSPEPEIVPCTAAS